MSERKLQKLKNIFFILYLNEKYLYPLVSTTLLLFDNCLGVEIV